MPLKHIAIIPDGNRRWARRKEIHPSQGHKIGIETINKIFDKSIELGVPYLTFWASSFDNLIKRPRQEVNFLVNLLTKEFQQLIKDARIQRNKVKVGILGRFKETLPPKTLKLAEELIKKTENHNLFSLTFLLAYNGTDEMLDAVRGLINFARERAIRVTKDLINNFLWTRDLPPVDLVIRTGCEGDPHNSAGFMMWHTVYSQYYFTNTLFPDFSPEELEKAVNDFTKRERRLGK